MTVSLENGPRRSHQCIGERDGDNIGMSPRLEIREPPSQPVRLLPMMAADGARVLTKRKLRTILLLRPIARPC